MLSQRERGKRVSLITATDGNHPRLSGALFKYNEPLFTKGITHGSGLILLQGPFINDVPTEMGSQGTGLHNGRLREFRTVIRPKCG